VIGTGGREFWERLVANGEAPPPPTRGTRPLQDAVQGAFAAMQRHLGGSGIACRVAGPTMPAPLPLPQLAEAAGLGTVSPVINALLHPRFGPWVSIRAAVLVVGKPFGPIRDRSIADTFQPCCSCSRPCLHACPTGVHDGTGASDLHRCLQHRDSGGCEIGCQVRRACPVGSVERYGPVEEQHRQQEERWLLDARFGTGFWRRMHRLWSRTRPWA
jgi:epoxyqueuosine reductase QueG